MNLCVFTGRLTKDVELLETSAGKSYAKFSIAINEGKDYTTFVNCTAWGDKAELIAKYFGEGNGKGRPLTVHSKVRNDKWEDKDGNERRSENFHVYDFNFLPSSNNNSAGEDTVEQTPKAKAKPKTTKASKNADVVMPSVEDDDDDIPF